MRGVVFADTFFWLAISRPRDAWHPQAVAWISGNAEAPMVTTDEVLLEFLNAMAKGGEAARNYAVATVRDIRSDASVTVFPQSRAGFDEAIDLYQSRLDKEYSLTDCRSMCVMREQRITAVLSNDHHFAQEGLTILFP